MRRRRQASAIAQPIRLPSRLGDQIPAAKHADWIARYTADIQAFQDRWDTQTIEQYVAADFAHVFAAIQYLRDDIPRPPKIANRFLEWGCGFGLITLLAVDTGWDAIGIESETELIAAGERSRQQLADAPNRGGQLIHGNFLPPGSETLSDNALHPSLNHVAIDAYAEIGLDVTEFGMIYSYPWPGENDFHRRVFETFAAPGAIHVQFAGPNDVRAWRKLG